jgi:hypothetical protein
MPTIKEKVMDVFENRIGEKFGREEIIDLVVNKYPETKRGSVIPSDYCYNMVNAGINSGINFLKNPPLFEYLGEARYKWLGLEYRYTGAIYWKGRKVGEWDDGNLTNPPILD